LEGPKGSKKKRFGGVRNAQHYGLKGGGRRGGVGEKRGRPNKREMTRENGTCATHPRGKKDKGRKKRKGGQDAHLKRDKTKKTAP